MRNSSAVMLIKILLLVASLVNIKKLFLLSQYL